MIRIDIKNRELTLMVDDDVLAARRKSLVIKPLKVEKGWLSRYSRLVTSADKGAVLK